MMTANELGISIFFFALGKKNNNMLDMVHAYYVCKFFQC